MRPPKSPVLLAFAALAATPLAAQLGLPAVSAPGLPPLGDVVDTPLATGQDLLRGTARQVSQALNEARLARIESLLSRNRAALERDAAGEPARRGTLVLLDPAPSDLTALANMGFQVTRSETIAGLEFAVTEVGIPAGLSLADAERLARQRLPGAMISSDPIYFQSGTAGGKRSSTGWQAPTVNIPVGFVDGMPAQPVSEAKGFAKGAPIASDHGSAVVSLGQGAGLRNVLVADVYGSDPAGGNALAIAQAMGWLVGKGARVISISLVGPRNPILERAVTATLARGVVIVAAVGNDGPAAPPSHPASYPGVIAITAVDKRNRPLIEAGRALHLDYAAPGADLAARNRAGRWVTVRGTSYATPLAAARAAVAIAAGSRANAVAAALDREAIPLSRRLPDPQTGRGLLCTLCR